MSSMLNVITNKENLTKERHIKKKIPLSFLVYIYASKEEAVSDVPRKIL